MSPSITIYMNRNCTECGAKGASVHGLCLYCSTEKLRKEKEKADPRRLVNTWVKKGANHIVEHYAISLADGKFRFACDKYVRVGEVVPGTGTNHSAYQCVGCSDAVGIKVQEYQHE